jgi:hypothetical protein
MAYSAVVQPKWLIGVDALSRILIQQCVHLAFCQKMVMVFMLLGEIPLQSCVCNIKKPSLISDDKHFFNLIFINLQVFIY